MKLEKAVNIEDLHRMAKRRLPKIAFDFIEGDVEDELASPAMKRPSGAIG
jgi:(S)-mandelate dehydrogenase